MKRCPSLKPTHAHTHIYHPSIHTHARTHAHTYTRNLTYPPAVTENPATVNVCTQVADINRKTLPPKQTTFKAEIPLSLCLGIVALRNYLRNTR